jgi:hypothetical protein
MNILILFLGLSSYLCALDFLLVSTCGCIHASACVCLCVCVLTQIIFCGMDFHEILFCEFLLIYVEKVQVWSERDKITDILHGDLHKY